MFVTGSRRGFKQGVDNGRTVSRGGAEVIKKVENQIGRLRGRGTCREMMAPSGMSV